MKAVSGGGVVGDVHMIVHKADGEVVRELKFPNLVLDVGYKELVKRMADPSVDWRDADGAPHIMTHLFLGTGTTEPTFSDTGLESRSGTLAGKMQSRDDMSESSSKQHMAQEVGNTIDFDNNYFDMWYKWRFAYTEGEAEGVWTELGLADSGYAYPFTRALIRDQGGSPTSITILSDEYLTVFYTIRFVNEPQDLGTITVDGVDSTVRFIPGATVYTDHRTYNDSDAAYQQSILASYPGGSASSIGALSAYTLDSSGYTVFFSSTQEYPGAFSQTVSYAGDYLVDLQLVLDPTDADEAVAGLVISNTPSLDYRYGNFGFLLFNPPLNKRADYRLTLDIDLDLTPEDGPVEGLGHTATSTTLDFTWDAYPNVTEYQLVLRQAGTDIDSQTVTSESASFTGLDPDTEYHLDIKPIATPRNGRRLIYAATTEAA